MFDIVIPVGPLDTEILEKQIEYTKRNVIGYRNIYLIPWDPTIQLEGCITIPESAFPFSIHTVTMRHLKTERNGWYFQQLLKLYAWAVVDGILDRYLVLDTDTFICKPTEFETSDGLLYMDWLDETYPQYKDHCLNLYPSLTYSEKSGIVNYMMFQGSRVKEMIETIEAYHNHTEPFWNLFLDFVDPAMYQSSGASEYQLYFSWILQNYPNEIILRQLKSSSVKNLNTTGDCSIVSWHWMNRPQSGKIWEDLVSHLNK